MNHSTTIFQKRFYSHPREFNAAIEDAFLHMNTFTAAHRSGRVSKPFAERIMLAVTQVNGCRYCQYGHARAALAAGVSPEDIQQLALGDLTNMPSEELVALTFAQHYAESGGQPDPLAQQRLVETYSETIAQDILANIRMITIGNLSGNTLDAFVSRLRGRPARESSIWKELGVLLGAFVIFPYQLVRYWLRRK